MIKKNFMAIGVFLILLMTNSFSEEISVSFNLGDVQTITVSAEITASTITVGEIQVCDGTCAYTKSIAPATEFTVQVKTTGDTNTNAFDLYFYQTADTNDSTTDWDNIKLITQTSAGNANGCIETGDYYCLTVQNTDWTTKFIDGAADIWIKATDNSANVDFNESTGAMTIGTTTGITSDSDTATYTTIPNSVQNAIYTSQGNAYVELANNGNITLDLDVNGADFISGGNTITKGNQKFNSDNNYSGASAITGTTQTIEAGLTRGTYPTSSTHNEWFWIVIPDQQPSGDYITTLAFGSGAS